MKAARAVGARAERCVGARARGWAPQRCLRALPSPLAMPTRLHKNRKKRGHVSAGHGRIGKQYVAREGERPGRRARARGARPPAAAL